MRESNKADCGEDSQGALIASLISLRSMLGDPEIDRGDTAQGVVKHTCIIGQ
jgi:hypothetical protein